MVSFGVDNFLKQVQDYKGKRLALVTNNAAVTSRGTSSRLALIEKGFNITKLFSPEHGLSTLGADGAFMNSGFDPVTGLPVISLYGDHLFPTAKELEDVDVVLYDIPDVGCRFYTYLWTMTYVMETCAAVGIPFILLDKPNPISGNLDLAEGPMLDEENTSSFLGRWSIPIRHCCTYGELASYFAAKKLKNLKLTIIPVSNWERNATEPAWGWNFTQTSPAIVTSSVALVYPATCFLEGVNVNEGRGTDTPFSICGSPWINPEELALQFNSLNQKGVFATAAKYIPVDGLYAGKECNGIKLFVTDTSAFRPVATGVELLKLLYRLYPNRLQERLYKTRANPSGEGHLDTLLGVKNAFSKIKAGEAFKLDIANEWRSLIYPYLLY